MEKILYFVKRLFHMNYRQLFSTARKVHRRTGKGTFAILKDMLRCGTRYGAGYMDYSLFEMDSLTPAQRATLVTRGVNNRIVKLQNDPGSYHIFEEKPEFNRLFGDFLGRTWIDLREAGPDEFGVFLAGKSVLIAKPADSICGRGVEKITVSPETNWRQLYQKLMQQATPLVEECLVQHPEMAAVYPGSVNTLRLVSMRGADGPHVVYVGIRIGRGGKVVDNFNAGGLFAPVELDSGKIEKVAVDKHDGVYTHHPDTGMAIVGFAPPFLKEAIEMVKTASARVPQVGYVGWDVAITPEGPVLIEGNHFPGNDIYEMAAHRDADGIGKLPRFKQVETRL